jgi:hypothetical protein
MGKSSLCESQPLESVIFEVVSLLELIELSGLLGVGSRLDVEQKPETLRFDPSAMRRGHERNRICGMARYWIDYHHYDHLCARDVHSSDSRIHSLIASLKSIHIARNANIGKRRGVKIPPSTEASVGTTSATLLLTLGVPGIVNRFVTPGELQAAFF